MPLNVAKTDYAINGGDYYTSVGTVFQGDQGPQTVALATSPAGQQTWAKYGMQFSGISYAASQVPMAQVTDGASNTYLIGEKYLDPDDYYDGEDSADNENAYIGDNADIVRWADPTMPPPHQDTPGQPTGDFGFIFSGPHSTGFGMAMCDGSVRAISYGIDMETHRRLANRHDGLPIDPSKY